LIYKDSMGRKLICMRRMCYYSKNYWEWFSVTENERIYEFLANKICSDYISTFESYT
jgi:hypothetical protein